MKCPVCQQRHDLSRAITGDWIWCPRCGAWLAVVHQDGRSSLLAKTPPERQPAARSRARGRTKQQRGAA